MIKQLKELLADLRSLQHLTVTLCDISEEFSAINLCHKELHYMKMSQTQAFSNPYLDRMISIFSLDFVQTQENMD